MNRATVLQALSEASVKLSSRAAVEADIDWHAVERSVMRLREQCELIGTPKRVASDSAMDSALRSIRRAAGLAGPEGANRRALSRAVAGQHRQAIGMDALLAEAEFCGFVQRNDSGRFVAQ